MRIISVLLALIAVVGAAPVASADDDRDHQKKFEARLSGYNEVIFAAGSPGPPVVAPALRGAVSTTGTGKFELKIVSDIQIDYTLSYKDLEGAITQAHIHFGQRHTPGGIVLFLCANPPAGPPATIPAPPLCPGIDAATGTTPEGTVEGVLTPANLIAVPAQGIGTGPAEFLEVIRAIRAGVTYANVHTAPLHTAGEIRGHIEPDDKRHGRRH